MIEDLMKLKNQIDTMIETYKDLHPETYFEYSEKTKKSLNMSLEIGSTMDLGSMTDEEYIKTRALKRVREGYYESTFREKQGKKTTESSKGSPSLCVYGDT